MNEYKFVRIVYESDVDALNKLLAEGWSPFRETPMGVCPQGNASTDYHPVVAAALVVLVRQWGLETFTITGNSFAGPDLDQPTIAMGANEDVCRTYEAEWFKGGNR